MFLVLQPAFAQKKHEREMPETPRGPQEAHSFLELFTNLEHELTTAVQNHDAAALEPMLAPEFILRSGADPHRIVKRDEWLRKILPDSSIQSFAQSDMTVRVFPGDTALVSYLQSQKAKNSAEAGQFMMVDVWVADHVSHKWQLAERYQSAIRAR